MKVEGLGSLVKRSSVTVTDAGGNSVELVVTAWPLGFHTELTRDLPPPVRPVKKIGQGRDGKPIMERDDQAPKYVAELARTNHLQSIALVFSALRNEPKVTWDAHPGDFETMRAFYEALSSEASDAGFTDAAVGTIIKATAKLSEVDDDSIEEASRVFSEAAPD